MNMKSVIVFVYSVGLAITLPHSANASVMPYIDQNLKVMPGRHRMPQMPDRNENNPQIHMSYMKALLENGWIGNLDDSNRIISSFLKTATQQNRLLNENVTKILSDWYIALRNDSRAQPNWDNLYFIYKSPQSYDPLSELVYGDDGSMPPFDNEERVEFLKKVLNNRRAQDVLAGCSKYIQNIVDKLTEDQQYTKPDTYCSTNLEFLCEHINNLFRFHLNKPLLVHKYEDGKMPYSIMRRIRFVINSFCCVT